MGRYSNLSPISSEEVRSLQLAIMDEIDAFCREAGIEYFLIAGTLIGAVRHQGYIPWDDDLDIALPREQYEKLIASFESRSGKVRILTHKNSSTYIYPFAKAIRTDTLLIESDEKHAIGVNIDIFPLENAPDDVEECRRIFKKMKRWRSLLDLKYMGQNPDRAFWKKAVVFVGRRALKAVPDRWVLHKLDKILKAAHNREVPVRYSAAFCEPRGACELYFTEDFSKQMDAPFEGRSYRIPVGYHRMLTAGYGDYMQPPPQAERVTHHAYRAYWR